MMEKKIYGMAMEGRELKKQKAGRIPKWDTALFWDEPYPLNLVREVLGHVTEYRLEESLRPERNPLEKREYIFSLAPEPRGSGSPSISSEQIDILVVEFALSRDMADSMDRYKNLKRWQKHTAQIISQLRLTKSIFILNAWMRGNI